jgi:hypothetical protein
MHELYRGDEGLGVVSVRYCKNKNANNDCSRFVVYNSNDANMNIAIYSR